MQTYQSCVLGSELEAGNFSDFIAVTWGESLTLVGVFWEHSIFALGMVLLAYCML